MLRVGAFALLMGVGGCPSNGPPPPPYPGIVYPDYLAVTEGASTMFQLTLTSAPSSDLTGVLYVQDHSVAYVMPANFATTPTSYRVWI
jgi:hypothetical protein